MDWMLKMTSCKCSVPLWHGYSPDFDGQGVWGNCSTTFLWSHGEDTVRLLVETGHFTEFAHFIWQQGLESEDFDMILKLKSVLWAVVCEI